MSVGTRLVMGCGIATTLAITLAARAQTAPPAPWPNGMQAPPGWVAPSTQPPPPPGYPANPGYAPQPGYPPQNQGYAPQPVYQQYPPPPNPGYAPRPSPASIPSTSLEIGVLYGSAAVYGAGLGLWIDAESHMSDPGVSVILPVVLGLSAPVGVYFADRYYPNGMPRGMPAAISAGLWLGAAEGVAIWSYQYTSSKSQDQWGERGFFRATAIGSTIGGAGGVVLALTAEPSPKASVFTGSGSVFGALVGSLMGYGTTNVHYGWDKSNDGAALGGLVGYNIGLVASAAVSTFYTPSWGSIGWIWLGGAIGAAAGAPVYLLYAGNDSNNLRRGMITQGITTTLGAVAGGIFSSGIKDDITENEFTPNKLAKLTGFGMMPVQGGMGLQMMGLLY